MKEKPVSRARAGSLRLASPPRRSTGHRAEVNDGPWTKTTRVIGLGLGPGDRARHGRPTSTEGCFPGLHPYCTRACTRWRLTGCTPRGVHPTLAPRDRGALPRGGRSYATRYLRRVALRVNYAVNYGVIYAFLTHRLSRTRAGPRRSVPCTEVKSPRRPPVSPALRACSLLGP